MFIKNKTKVACRMSGIDFSEELSILESCFLPARCYASAGNSDRNVSVRPSVRHAPVLCQNEESFFTVW